MASEHGRRLVLISHPRTVSNLLIKILNMDDDSAQETHWLLNVPKTYSTTRSPLNHRLLSDDFLKSWFPTFIVRHPSLGFPSYYRILKAADNSEDNEI